jgi:hypothetical protein
MRGAAGCVFALLLAAPADAEDSVPIIRRAPRR